jgi:hypothetical protein
MDSLYRSMKKAEDGFPETGRSSRKLGVRMDGVFRDLTPDLQNRVQPKTGGLSVTVDDPSQIPPARRPRWLPCGLSEDPLFHIAPSSVGSSLTIRVDAGAHALVEPAEPMLLPDYETAIEATRPHWQEAPPP